MTKQKIQPQTTQIKAICTDAKSAKTSLIGVICGSTKTIPASTHPSPFKKRGCPTGHPQQTKQTNGQKSLSGLLTLLCRMQQRRGSRLTAGN